MTKKQNLYSVACFLLISIISVAAIYQGFHQEDKEIFKSGSCVMNVSILDDEENMRSDLEIFFSLDKDIGIIQIDGKVYDLKSGGIYGIVGLRSLFTANKINNALVISLTKSWESNKHTIDSSLIPPHLYSVFYLKNNTTISVRKKSFNTYAVSNDIFYCNSKLSS